MTTQQNTTTARSDARDAMRQASSHLTYVAANFPDDLDRIADAERVYAAACQRHDEAKAADYTARGYTWNEARRQWRRMGA